MSEDALTATEIVVDWIKREIGPVRNMARQGRWPPAWFVGAERHREIVQLYVHGGRGGHFGQAGPCL